MSVRGAGGAGGVIIGTGDTGRGGQVRGVGCARAWEEVRIQRLREVAADTWK